MYGAYVLVLEDDPHWRKTIHDVLDPEGAHVSDAANLAEAEALLAQRYFNVAIVDVSLRPGDPRDSQGMAFLEAVRKAGLEDTVCCLVLSAYGDVKRVREAFRDFQVVDFLEKANFDQKALLLTIAQALERNHLKRDVSIEIAGQFDLPHLWRHLNWTQREESQQLEIELHDLLLRLFPDADRLFIKELPGGQSGAGILEVEPCYGAQVGASVAVKFGKRDKIRQEQQNYEESIQRFVGARASTQLSCALGRAMGAICYQLIGAELADMSNFADHYRQDGVADLYHVLDNLFRKSMGQWYDNREQPRRRRDLVALYESGLHIVWEEVWETMASLGFEVDAPSLRFPGLTGSFFNPKQWLEKHNYRLYLPVWRTITHGDLNEHNILVSSEGECWLIDFYRSGLGHILRDVAELETVIKFSLAEITDLVEYKRFEHRLVGQQRIDRPVQPTPDDPHFKPLAVIAHLRSLADSLTGRTTDMTEYNTALVLTTLNLLRLEFMGKQQHVQALLSAAMLCAQLSASSGIPLT